MILKEYPNIVKGNEEIISKTSLADLVFDFTGQMYEREKTGICFFSDKKNAENLREEDICGLSWTDDFMPEDLLMVVNGYMHFCLDKKQKMAFAVQLQNLILAETMNDEEDDESVYGG